MLLLIAASGFLLQFLQTFFSLLGVFVHMFSISICSFYFCQIVSWIDFVAMDLSWIFILDDFFLLSLVFLFQGLMIGFLLQTKQRHTQVGTNTVRLKGMNCIIFSLFTVSKDVFLLIEIGFVCYLLRQLFTSLSYF